MDKIYAKARGKINLSLNVLDKREDGYHNLELTFQIINLYDEIYIEKNNSNEIELYCTNKEFKTEDNLVYKAYKVLKEKYPQITGLKVRLIKHIPTGTGMAGGSADCANFILMLNKMFDLNLSQQELINLGKSLGADVPACMYKCATLGRGIGEDLERINSKLKYYLVIVKPDVSFSTKEMFKKIDLKGNIVQRYTSDKVKQALENQDIDLLVKNMYNVFEQAVDNKELIDNIKKEFIENGAKTSLMTGSGSCVYGIFTDRQFAKQAYKILKKKYLTFITVPYEKDVKIFD